MADALILPENVFQTAPELPGDVFQRSSADKIVAQWIGALKGLPPEQLETGHIAAAKLQNAIENMNLPYHKDKPLTASDFAQFTGDNNVNITPDGNKIGTIVLSTPNKDDSRNTSLHVEELKDGSFKLLGAYNNYNGNASFGSETTENPIIIPPAALKDPALLHVITTIVDNQASNEDYVRREAGHQRWLDNGLAALDSGADKTGLARVAAAAKAGLDVEKQDGALRKQAETKAAQLPGHDDGYEKRLHEASVGRLFDEKFKEHLKATEPADINPDKVKNDVAEFRSKSFTTYQDHFIPLLTEQLEKKEDALKAASHAAKPLAATSPPVAAPTGLTMESMRHATGEQVTFTQTKTYGGLQERPEVRADTAVDAQGRWVIPAQAQSDHMYYKSDLNKDGLTKVTVDAKDHVVLDASAIGDNRHMSLKASDQGKLGFTVAEGVKVTDSYDAATKTLKLTFTDKDGKSKSLTLDNAANPELRNHVEVAVMKDRQTSKFVTLPELEKIGKELKQSGIQTAAGTVSTATPGGPVPKNEMKR